MELIIAYVVGILITAKVIYLNRRKESWASYESCGLLISDRFKDTFKEDAITVGIFWPVVVPAMLLMYLLKKLL